MRTVGTTSRGVRCTVVREGDDLVKIVTDAILACGEEQGLTFHDRDIVAVTEAVVARSQGNYAGVEDSPPTAAQNSAPIRWRSHFPSSAATALPSA